MTDNNEEELDYRDFEDPYQAEVEDGECPECKGNRIFKTPRQTSPDDYVWQYECRDCGATWED